MLYARDPSWRRSMAKSLEQAGHSQRAASTPAEVRELLVRQRFDVLTLKVRDSEEARQLAEALDGVPLPAHGILVGSASALTLLQRSKRAGDFRYVPGALPVHELSRLVDASISSGASEESAAENSAAAQIEEIDLEEAIERAAASVYPEARRKRQRFNTVVEGPTTNALANAARLQRTLVTLLSLIVESAPRGALVSAEARAAGDEWTVRVRASGVSTDSSARLTEALHHKAQALTTASRDARLQGGLLWVELTRGATVGACLTLPLPSDDGEHGHT